jgi:dihydroorotate dehydrogenase electron transfer subunit
MSIAALARVTVVERAAPMEGAVELLIVDQEMSSTAQPGQFFQIGVEAPHTLLPRPYSVATIDRRSGRLGFLFSVVGAGSAWLSSLRPGDRVRLIGPLGQGFAPSQDRTPVCVGGGLGIAPFPALCAALVAAGRRPLLLQGAREAARLLPDRWFAGSRVLTATDDASAGRPGSVVGLLETVAARDQEWFVCGPTPMLQSIVRLADAIGLPHDRIQVALETPMGCGVGTCLGCATPAAGGGYLLACQDGPCVGADRVDWSRVEDAFHD